MAQTIALQARAPKFDWAKSMGTAQDLVRNDQLLDRGRMQNAGAAIDLQQKQGEASALDQFRMKRAAGDTQGAMKALDAYPMIQAQMHKALDSMKPDQVAQAKKVADEFWQSYTYVQRFMPGTPEQSAAWNKEIDRLSSGGYIDGQTAEHWKKAGPSDLILDQARMVRSAVDSYKPKGEGEIPEKVQAREDHMEEWNKQHVPKRGGFSGEAPREEEWASYYDRYYKEYQRYSDTVGLDVDIDPPPPPPGPEPEPPGLWERMFGAGKQEQTIDEGGIPDNRSGAQIIDQPDVAADNAKQEKLSGKVTAIKSFDDFDRLNIGDLYIVPGETTPRVKDRERQ